MVITLIEVSPKVKHDVKFYILIFREAGEGDVVARDLAADGATVQVHDMDPSRRQDVEASGLDWWDSPMLSESVDILVPAATGGLLTPEAARTCRARLIVGPANNQITDDVVDEVLHRRVSPGSPMFWSLASTYQ